MHRFCLPFKQCRRKYRCVFRFVFEYELKSRFARQFAAWDYKTNSQTVSHSSLSRILMHFRKRTNVWLNDWLTDYEISLALQCDIAFNVLYRRACLMENSIAAIAELLQPQRKKKNPQCSCVCGYVRMQTHVHTYTYTHTRIRNASWNMSWWANWILLANR